MFKKQLQRFFIKYFPFREQLKIFPMSEKEAWEIYAAISRVPRIKDLFELRRQLARIMYMETDDKIYKGIVQDVEEMLENMENAQKNLKSLEKLPENISGGYKSILEQ